MALMIHGTLHKGVIQEFPNYGTHCVGGWNYYVANLPTGQNDANGTPIYANFQISKNAGMYSTDNLGNVTEIALFPQNLTLTTSSATLNNVAVWSANSILTRSYADGRFQAVGSYLTASSLTSYQLIANNTYANLTGKPTLANVATSGSYNDLSNKPTTYSLPYATNSTSGGVIVGGNLSINNGVLSAFGGVISLDGGSAATTNTGSYDGGSAIAN